MDSRILIIDDDQTMLELLQTLLTMEGFEVNILEAQSSLADMVKKIKEDQPALILCDVLLKDLDGLDLLRLIREDSGFDQIKVLMSSGMDFSHQCLEARADGFISKPYMPDDLVQKIQNLLSATPK